MYHIENPMERGSEFVLKMSRIFTIIKGKKAKENISFEHADANKVNLGFTPAESGPVILPYRVQ